MPLASARESNSPDPDEPAPGAADGRALQVLVVAADEAERARLRSLVGAVQGMRNTGNSGHGGHAHGSARPDVLLLHLDPRTPGMERRLRETLATWHPAPVLVLSESADGVVNREFVRRGARGVVPKGLERDQLVAAIRRVKDGEIWLSRSCLSIIIDEMAAAKESDPAPHSRDPFVALTEREREVVSHIAEGLHNRAIAGRLGITENTVRHHLTAIYGKVGVADRLELAVYALRHRPGGGGRK